MKKVKIKKIVESMLLCITFMMIVLSCHTVKQVTTLNQDDKGRYCINTADDYYFFVENNNKSPIKQVLLF